MGDINRQTHIREMKPIAQADERQADDVMGNQLFEILARLFHAQQHHDSLLGPVCRLEQVVKLEDGLVGLMGKRLVHPVGVEVPHRRATHDVHPRGTQEAEVDGRVELFHKAGLFGPRFQARSLSQGAEEFLHDELPGEGQDDGVEGHEGDVPETFAIPGDLVGGGGGQFVGEEDEVVDGVGLGWVYGEEEAEDGEDGERNDPGVLDGVVFCAAEGGAGFAPLGRLFERGGILFGVCAILSVLEEDVMLYKWFATATGMYARG